MQHALRAGPRPIRRSMPRAWLGLAAALVLLPPAPAARAQDAVTAYPSRPIRLVIPFAAGGPPDALARALGQQLGERWGQPVVVDNKAGAGGSIGAETVAKSPPDGYTLLLSTTGVVAVNPSLSKVGFDTLRDFSPVLLAATIPSLLVVPPSLNVKTAKEFIALAKSRPGALNYGSSGPGSASHLAMAMFDKATGIELQHVPYKGAAPAVTDLLGGNLQAMMIGVSTVLPYVNAGKLVALGVSSPRPSPLAPGLPTIAEAAGMPGFEVSNWMGLFAPAGTSPAIVDRLNAEITAILRRPETWQSLSRDGFEPVPANSPAEFGRYLREEITRWSRLVKDASITAN